MGGKGFYLFLTRLLRTASRFSGFARAMWQRVSARRAYR